MKTLNTLPNDRTFFDVYAKLIRTLFVVGILAQIVSAGTEIGGINTAVLSALEPLRLGAWAALLAALVALLATAVIEGGLRETFPKAIDAILYGRWSGLHLWMSVFVWLLSVVLLTASVWLSFSNSKIIVEDVTPHTEKITTAAADSIRAQALAEALEVYRADSALTAANYAGRIESTAQAYDSKIKAAKAALAALEAKERRTGSSYATRKDRAAQRLADIEADKAGELAKLQDGLAASLHLKNGIRREAERKAGKIYADNLAEVKTENQEAEDKRTATVTRYGGGLAWFSIVCQVLFVVSVILDRIQRKGSGIEETVQIGAYDFRPGWIVEAWAALVERFQYWTHSKIKAFADQTPAAPKPAEPGAVYDIAQAMQQVTFRLELSTATDEEERVVYLNAKEPDKEAPPPERRRIGFTRDEDTKGRVSYAHEKGAAHEADAHEAAHETPDLREAKRRLKMYRKRLGVHQGKAQTQREKKGKVCKRTADAITNNRQWVSHYENIINQLQNQ